MNATLRIDHDAPSPDGTVHLRALVRIQGEVPEGKARVPLNLSLVLDRSGSMQGAKLVAARHAAAGVVRRMWPEDVVSVVAYDDEVAVVAEPATGRDQPDLTRQIESIESGGSTNLSGGWLTGLRLAGRMERTGGVNRVILLTDGLANAGITDPDQLAGLFRKAADQGFTTSTIGFGEDFDERLLRALADAGRGNTYYIEHPDQAHAIFADELEGLLSLTAQNLTATITLGPAARLVAVHHSYPRYEVPGGVELALGDLYAREPRALLVEIVGSVSGEDPVEVAVFTLEADVLGQDGSVERRTIRLPIRVSRTEGAQVDPEIQREVLLQATARAREEALERQARGDFHGAADALRDAAARVREGGAGDAQLLEEANDLSAMAGTFAQGAVREADTKYLAQAAYNTSRSRSERTSTFRRKRS